LWEGGKFKSNILEYKKDYDGLHPTQKPILLLEDLVKTFSYENDLVVDLTMGSGSTGVACRNTKRNFIGIEKEKQYYDVAVRRASEYCG
jgi:DNA modification methylase